MQSGSGNQLVENLFTNGRHINLSVVFVSQNLFYMGKKCRTISLNSTYIVVFKNLRDQSQIRHLACQMFPTKIPASSLRRRNERYLSVFILRYSSQFTRICESSWKYFPMWPVRRVVFPLSPKRHANLVAYKRNCVSNEIFICVWIGWR